MKKSFIYFLMAMIAIAACRKNEDNIKITKVYEYVDPGKVINTSILGTVVDENGQAIEGANVSLGDHRIQTNSDGVFSFRDVATFSKATYIKVEKDGFFDGMRLINTSQNVSSYIDFQLIQKKSIGRFASDNGGQIISPDGIELDFSGRSIVDEVGNIYSGEVNVLAHWFNPTAPDFSERLPGSLLALTEEEEEVSLISYSMIAVELEGRNGEKLNIADGKEVEIKFPLDPNLALSAPDEIGLWSLDEELGLWIEEGKAVKDGDHYIANVSHFSFWNCDDEFANIDFRLQVTDDIADCNLTGFRVELSFNNGARTSSGLVDASGNVEGKIPSNVELDIVITEKECDVIVYQGKIGPYSAGPVNESIKVDLTNFDISLVRGAVFDCDGGLIRNAYVSIEGTNGGRTITYSDDAGYFETCLLICPGTDSVRVRAFDFEDKIYSSWRSYVVADTVDVSRLNLCEDLTGIATLEMDGNIITMYEALASRIDNGGKIQTRIDFIAFDTYGNSCWEENLPGDEDGFLVFNHEGVGIHDYIKISMPALIGVSEQQSFPFDTSYVKVSEYGQIDEDVIGELSPNFTFVDWCTGDIADMGKVRFRFVAKRIK